MLKRIISAAFFGALAMAVVAPTAASAVAPAATAAESPAATRAFSDISGCIAGGERASVLMVVDESGSLAETDPRNGRVEAMLIALNGLERLQSEAPEKTIDVAASTFSTEYQRRIDWAQADSGHIESLKSFARDEVPALNAGAHTDYRQAMQGAQSQFNDNGDGCRVLLWFTDGGLDVGNGTSGEIESAYKDICARGGIADSLRSKGVAVVAIALTQGDSVSASDKAKLQGIAEGSGAGDNCGTTPMPERFARGAYLPVADAASLVRVFADAMARIGGYTDVANIKCPGDGCRDGSYNFDVDPGIDRVRVLATATGGQPRFTLTAPDGSETALKDGTSEGAGTTVEVARSGSATELDMKIGDEAGRGRWTLSATDGEAQVQSWFHPGVSLELADPGQSISADDGAEVILRAVRDDGSAFDEAVYASADLAAASGSGEQYSTEARGSGEWAVSVPAISSGRQLLVSIDLQAELALTSSPSSIELDPVATVARIPVTTAAGYPKVLSEGIEFPAVTEPGVVTASLPVEGSDLGPSQVCLAGSELTGPAGSVPVSAQGASPDGCVDVAQGQQADIEITADPQAIEDGAAIGELDVQLVSAAEGDETLSMSLPAELGMSRPVNEWQRGPVVVLAVLLAILLPFLIVWLLGRTLAVFPPLRNLQYVRLPVLVRRKEDDGEFEILASDGSPLRLTADDLRWLRNSDSDTKELDVREVGIRFVAQFGLFRWRQVAGWRVPWLDIQPSARAELADPRGRAIASNRNPFTRDDRSAPADLHIQNAWFLVARRSELGNGERYRADLVAFGRGADLLSRLNDGSKLLPVFVEAMSRALGRYAEKRAGDNPPPDPLVPVGVGTAPPPASPATWL